MANDLLLKKKIYTIRKKNPVNEKEQIDNKKMLTRCGFEFELFYENPKIICLKWKTIIIENKKNMVASLVAKVPLPFQLYYRIL